MSNIDGPRSDTSVEPPRWASEVQRLLAYRSLLVLHGNTLDQQFVPVGRPATWTRFDNLTDALYSTLQGRGYGLVVSWDAVRGFRFPDDATRLAFDGLKGQTPEAGEDSARVRGDVAHALEKARACMLTSESPCAIVVNFTNQLVAGSRNLQENERINMLRALIAATEADVPSLVETADGPRVTRNALVLVCGSLADVPSWLYRDNPAAACLLVDRPHVGERRLLLRHLADERLAARPELIEQIDFDGIASLTDGLTATDVRSIFEDMTSTALDPTAQGLPNLRERGAEAVERFRLGVQQSEWDDTGMWTKAATAEDFLSARVKGQPTAVRHVADVLCRSVTGLSGIQHSAGRSKPRGVLFFAGPTGVGKTEMARAIAQLIFNDQDRMTRFDMSEYGNEHDDTKLLGAPPSYIGYEEGGQLTEAIKSNPFRVLLFDEIEKANRRILDKFLQVIEDGRMTDGQGDTVYFSESLIVFTSNAGTFELDDDGRPRKDGSGNAIPRVRADEDPDVVRAKIAEGVRQYFTTTLGRPELLNRLGPNIVVFGFLDRNSMGEVLDQKLQVVTAKIFEETGLTVEFDDSVRLWLLDSAVTDVANGGRAVGNLLEAEILNPLARWIVRTFSGPEFVAEPGTGTYRIVGPGAAGREFSIVPSERL